MCRNWNHGDVFHRLLCSLSWQSPWQSRKLGGYCRFLCISILLNTIVGDILWATYQIKIYSELASCQQGLKVVVPKLLDHKFCFWMACYWTNSIPGPFSEWNRSHIKSLKWFLKQYTCSTHWISLAIVDIPKVYIFFLWKRLTLTIYFSRITSHLIFFLLKPGDVG